MRKALTHYGGRYHENKSLRQNTAELIKVVFDDKVKREYVLSLYEKMPLEHVGEEDMGDDVTCELDAETMELLDELAGDEAENAQDLKQLKGDMSKDMMRKVAQARATTRVSRRARAINTKIRREKREKVVGGKFARGQRQNKQNPRNTSK